MRLLFDCGVLCAGCCCVVIRKPVQYTETVEPTSIARRLMEIREQVAEQLGADLQQMAAENNRLQEDYQYEVYNRALLLSVRGYLVNSTTEHILRRV